MGVAVILYMAISVDGYIAGQNEETPWSDEEWVAFQSFVETCEVCLLGRRTYEIMRDSEELIRGVRYIVVTRDREFDSGSYEKMSLEPGDHLPGVGRIGIIGGGDLNGTLAEFGLIDEIILDIESI